MKLFVPIDMFVGISRSRRRLLEVPTVLCDSTGKGKAIRFEFCLLLNVVIICDYKVIRIFSTD